MRKEAVATPERGLFVYGDEVIHYDVLRQTAAIKSPELDNNSKKSRQVTIKVHPDQRVVATVPIDATSEAIQTAIVKQARWVWQHIIAFRSLHDHVLPRHYVSGETQFYLGRRYMLKVSIDTNASLNVKLLRGKLSVILRSEEKKIPMVKTLVNEWYQHRAQIIFQEQLNKALPKTTWVSGRPSLRILTMKKQWGSCSPKGDLLLNPHLVKAPKECIEYVILHELCHIAEHNHSERFWHLLTQVMPNWKVVKGKLDAMAELYLNE